MGFCGSYSEGVLMTANYYSISFSYPGPFFNHGYSGGEDGDPPSKISAAEEEIDKLAIQILPEIEIKHEYSFPDGSLYKYAKSELDALDFITRLEDKIISMGLSLIKIQQCNEIPATSDPWKHNCKTVEEYFAKEHK